MTGDDGQDEQDARLPYTAARVERVVWAFRSPNGRRWAYATLWVQALGQTRVIVWTDRGRHRLAHFDQEVEAAAELARMEQALVNGGWTRVDQLRTAQGYVIAKGARGE